MIFEVDNIELYYKEKRILNGIYLKAETGKTIAILGSNGCGKSSLLNIIFGSLKPKYKLIRINGKPILKPLYITKRIAYLPQNNFIPHTLKLKTAFKLYGVSWGDFISTFQGFHNYLNFKTNKLSGGERRVVETYLILKSDKDIILLDEPFSHISPIHIEKIKALIQQEKQNKAIILTDHMYKHIVDISDGITLLKNGCSKPINDLKELEDYRYLNYGSI